MYNVTLMHCFETLLMLRPLKYVETQNFVSIFQPTYQLVSYKIIRSINFTGLAWKAQFIRKSIKKVVNSIPTLQSAGCGLVPEQSSRVNKSLVQIITKQTIYLNGNQWWLLQRMYFFYFSSLLVLRSHQNFLVLPLKGVPKKSLQ